MRYAMLESRAVRIAPIDAVPVQEARSVRESLRLFGRRISYDVVLSSANWKVRKLIATLDPFAHLNLQSGDIPARHRGYDFLRRLVHAAVCAVVDVGFWLFGLEAFHLALSASMASASIKRTSAIHAASSFIVGFRPCFR